MISGLHFLWFLRQLVHVDLLRFAVAIAFLIDLETAGGMAGVVHGWLQRATSTTMCAAFTMLWLWTECDTSQLTATRTHWNQEDTWRHFFNNLQHTSLLFSSLFPVFPNLSKTQRPLHNISKQKNNELSRPATSRHPSLLMWCGHWIQPNIVSITLQISHQLLNLLESHLLSKAHIWYPFLNSPTE